MAIPHGAGTPIELRSVQQKSRGVTASANVLITTRTLDL